MTEQKAMAYVNMYGVLGALENLCEMDAPAKKTLAGIEKPVSICFEVKNGPCCTFCFSKKECRMIEGSEGSNCKMTFASCEKFNAMINSGKPGFPAKGLLKTLKFLAGPFTNLTNRLTELLRPTEENMKDPAFFEENTLLTMYTIAGAISALANSDSISMQSAENTTDGDVLLKIKDKAAVTISVKEHHFTTIKKASENPRAIMEFSDINLANGLFNGKVSTVDELCRGNIHLAGMISMVDNINRILDRVSVYLA